MFFIRFQTHKIASGAGASSMEREGQSRAIRTTILRVEMSDFKHTVSAIIIGEMEMWRCPEYLFPVAESKGGII